MASHEGALDMPARAKLPRSFDPWTRGELGQLVTGHAVGLVLMIAGWNQARTVSSVPISLAWLSVGLAGLGVTGLANGLWLCRGLRAVGRPGVLAVPIRQSVAPAMPPAPTADDGRVVLVSGAGMSRYHRHSCPLAASKNTEVAGRDDHERAGLTPCGVCEP